MCANLLCDRERPCAACKEDGRARLARAIARKLATFDDPIIDESVSFRDIAVEPAFDADYDGGGPMFSRGGEDRLRQSMQDRAFRRAEGKS